MFQPATSLFRNCLAWTVISFFFVPASLWGQTVPKKESETLILPAPGTTATRTITDGVAQIAEIELEEDEFVEIFLRQGNLPIVSKALNEKDEILTRFFSPNGIGARQEIVFIAPRKGRYAIHLATTEVWEEQKGSTAEYSLTFQTRRKATPEDHAYALAWRARAIVTTDSDTRPAIPLARKALELYRGLGNRAGEAEALFQMSRAYLYADGPEQTVRLCPTALAIFRETGSQPHIIRALNVLAVAHTQIGEFYKAIEYLREAVAIEKSMQLEIPLADSLMNLGDVLVQIGDDQGAIASYEPARIIFEKKRAISHLNAINGQLGGAFGRTGNYAKAIQYLEIALNSYTDAGKTTYPEDFEKLSTTFLNLALLYNRLGERLKAVANVEKAFDQSRHHKSRKLEAQCFFIFGLIHLENHDSSEAARQMRQSVEIARSGGFRSIETIAIAALAQAEFQQGNLDEALKLATETIARTESIRGGLEDEQLRATYFGSVQSRYELFYTLLMELHRRQPTAGNDVKAFLVSERAKARTLIDILRTKSITTDADQAVIIQRRKVQSRINETNRTLFGLSQTPEDVKRRAELEKELAAAIEQYRDLTTQLQKLNPKFVRLTEPVALDLAEIRNQLSDDSVLLEYALGAEKSYLWAVTRTGLKSYELPGRPTIEDLTRRTCDALTARGQKVRYEDKAKKAARVAQADRQYLALSKELGQLLLGPVAAELSGKKVLVVGDGALLYLPFAALPLPTTGNPLVATCEVTQLPSISTLSVLRQDAAGRQPAPRTVAVFADPVFESGDPRVQTEKTGPAAPATTSPVRDDVTRAAAEVDGTDRDATLIRLPFTRAEAEAIGKLVPQSGRSIALDFEASREAVFNQDLSKFRFVHFATHGLLNSTTPDLSGIVLSMVDEKGKPTDGFIHAYEVFNLKLPVEMVVLSGCRTGLGKEIRGEGMIGLTRGFLYAGAERVLVSLWAVEDSATATLMTDTYAGMLNRKLRPAAALRAAQLKMMADPKLAHPFYWAAFTLQGEPR